VNISHEAPWEDRYGLLKPKWDTHPYDLAKYEKDVRTLKPRSEDETVGWSKGDVQSLLRQLRDHAIPAE